MGIRIALQGEIASGKSTLADYMAGQYDWYVMRYSDSLKWALCEALNWFEDETAKEYFADDIASDKNKYRRALQELGSVLGFDKGVGVASSLKDWKQNRDSVNQPVIFDNVRFPAQFELLKPHGFLLVELDLDDNTRVRRVREMGYTSEQINHVSEKSRPMPDIILNANGSVEEVAERLLMLNGQRVARKAA